MPLYLIQTAYTADSWKTQIQKQGNIRERVGPVVEALGGQLREIYYAFGDYDVVGVVELPDDEAAAAFALTVTAGGALTKFKTTPLLSAEQGIDAMKRASQAGGSYTPPS